MTVRALVACETSGAVRRALRRKGVDAWSCDVLPADDGETLHHIQDKAQHLLGRVWDLVIAHPPCTYLANSGARWLYNADGAKNEERWEKMREGAEFFLECLNANADRVAVENPVMHRHAADIIGRRQDFTIQPWQFGDNFKKRTCFWTRGLPRLVPTSDLDGSSAYAACHREQPGPDRWKKRSATYPGIADAIADQWGVTPCAAGYPRSSQTATPDGPHVAAPCPGASAPGSFGGL